MSSSNTEDSNNNLANDAKPAAGGETATAEAEQVKAEAVVSETTATPAASEVAPTNEPAPAAPEAAPEPTPNMTVVTDDASAQTGAPEQTGGSSPNASDVVVEAKPTTVVDTPAQEVAQAQAPAAEAQQPPPPQQQQQQDATKCNLTLVLHEKQKMALEQRPLPPKPQPDQVQLATHTVGICGSDVKYWQCGRIGSFVLEKPMILGHETSAIVMEVGERVTNLKPGDKVAVEVGLPCSTCQLCRQGKYNLCSQMAFAATPPYDGTLTRYFNHPANFCFKLPETMSLEEGALLEPMAVAVHACQRAPIKLGDVVLVCGAGAVGLLSMLTAKAFGASHVISTDISPDRLKFAKDLGASETVLITREEKPADVAARVRQMVQKFKPTSDGVDVVLECSGAESSMHLAIQAAGVGAQIVCVGCQADTVTIPLNCAVMQEIDIKGVFRYRNCYPLAMSLVETGKINLRPLISHHFRLEESVQAFETCSRGEGVKILIKCMDDKLNLEDKKN